MKMPKKDKQLEAKVNEIKKLNQEITPLRLSLKASASKADKLKSEVASLKHSFEEKEAQAKQKDLDIASLNSKLISAQEKEKHLIESNRNLAKQVRELRDLVKAIEKSYTFRIGKAITGLASKIKHALKSK